MQDVRDLDTELDILKRQGNLLMVAMVATAHFGLTSIWAVLSTAGVFPNEGCMHEVYTCVLQ